MARQFKRRGKLAAVSPDPADPLTWYKRGEVARILNCSLQTVINYERRGRIRATICADGIHRFDPAEVRLLVHRFSDINKRTPRPTRGDIEADAYLLLDQGRTRRDIVTILRITSEEAQRIWAKYQIDEFDRADELDRKHAKELREAKEARAREQQRQARMKRIRELFQATITGGDK